jgi:hypothetical protein
METWRSLQDATIYVENRGDMRGLIQRRRYRKEIAAALTRVNTNTQTSKQLGLQQISLRYVRDQASCPDTVNTLP